MSQSHTETKVINKSAYPQEKGVYLTQKTEHLDEFIRLYHKVCEKEHRIYSDAQLKELPKAFAYNAHYKEWAMKEKSLNRFLKYFKRKKTYLYILDIGCGNGWFTEKLAKNQAHQVFGIDAYLPALEQAATVFKLPNLSFFHGDIQEDVLPFYSFDMLILNNSIQYFPDLYHLIHRCLKFLKLGGEIHIMNSPIYKPSDIAQASEASLKYYKELNLEEMAKYVYQHSTDDLLAFRHKVLYRQNRLKTIWTKTQEDFPWIRIIKDEEL